MACTQSLAWHYTQFLNLKLKPILKPFTYWFKSDHSYYTKKKQMYLHYMFLHSFIHSTNSKTCQQLLNKKGRTLTSCLEKSTKIFIFNCIVFNLQQFIKHNDSDLSEQDTAAHDDVKRGVANTIYSLHIVIKNVIPSSPFHNRTVWAALQNHRFPLLHELKNSMSCLCCTVKLQNIFPASAFLPFYNIGCLYCNVRIYLDRTA